MTRARQHGVAQAPGGAKIDAKLLQRVARMVRERGDVTMLLAIDRISELDKEAEQITALAAVIQQLAKTKNGKG